MLFRNNHPAFNGTFQLQETAKDILHIKWINNKDKAELFINLASMQMKIQFSKEDKMVYLAATSSALVV